MARKSHKKKKPHGKRLDKKIRNRAAGEIARRKRERKRGVETFYIQTGAEFKRPNVVDIL